MSGSRPEQVAAQILALLEAAGIQYVLHEHVAVRTIAEARDKVSELTRDLLKTVAFAIKGTSRLMLAAVAAESEVDYKALAAAVGCNRRDLRLLPAEQVERELGFEVGGLGPFALQGGVEVIIDDSIEPARTVRCGGGLRTRTLELSLADLARVSNAQRAAIALRARS